MNRIYKAIKVLKKPVYWRFIITYLLVVVIVIVALIPMYHEALSISKQIYLDKAYHGMMQSADDFEKTLETALQIPNNMKQSIYFNKMKLFRGNKLESAHYIYLDLIRKSFSQQISTNNLPDESFMIFTNSGVAVTRNRICETIQDCFSIQLIYDEYSVEDIISKVTNIKNYKSAIPNTSVSIDFKNNKRKYLTLLTRQINESVVVGTLFSENSLLEMFSIPDLPKETIFYIKNCEGNILLAHNFAKDPFELKQDIVETSYNDVTYNMLKHSMKSIGYEVIIGIPDNYFTGILAPIRSLNKRYILVALAIGLLFSMIFALLNYIPLNKLLGMPMMHDLGKRKPFTNEYCFLREHMENSDYEIKKLRSKIKDMDDNLRLNLFIRLLHGNVNTDDEKNLAISLIPQLSSDYCIAMVKIDAFDDRSIDYISFFVYEQLTHLLPPEFLLGQLDRTKTAILIPSIQENTEIFSKAIMRINNNIKAYNVALTAGISETCESIDKMNTGFNHAQFSLLVGNRELIHYYTAVPIKESLSIDLKELQRLYEYIRTGKCNEIEDMLNNACLALLNAKTHSADEVRKTFYIIRFVFESLLKNMNCSTIILPEYNGNITIKKLFYLFINVANDIALELESRKQNAHSELKKQVLDYIQDNFSSKSIFARSIASEFGISEGLVYEIAKDCTGLTLNEYIRKLRTDKAAQVLKTTDLSVTNISEVCGFDVLRTFYRAFKREYGVTPSEYRG